MIHYRLLMFVATAFAGWSVMFEQIQSSKAENRVNEVKASQYFAQDSAPAPTEVDPLEILNPKGYDTYMKEGYTATDAGNYDKALESFKKALQVKPDNIYAKQAIQNVEVLRLSSPRNSWPIFLQDPRWIILSGVGFIGAIAAVLYFLNRKPKAKPPEFQKEEVIEHHLPLPSQETRFSPEDRDEESQMGESAFPLQKTTRIPTPEFVEELLRELQNPDPKRRRKAIWKLAQKADSRAMKPLVELMIDSDSFERNLILEALSQISARTIKPMNQALALSLQDKNPQVRKNAIRDLTRLYDMMSQVSQLLCHAIDDQDEEVKATARWALNQLNLQMPPRLDLLLNRDDNRVSNEPRDEDIPMDSTSVDY